MPSNEENIPSTIERSPDKVQRTYDKALDSAHEEYHDEERAHRTAWASVKNVAEKKGDHWELKDGNASGGSGGSGGTGPSDPRSEQSNPENLSDPARSYGGVNVNKPKKELEADAREAGIPGRSR